MKVTDQNLRIEAMINSKAPGEVLLDKNEKFINEKRKLQEYADNLFSNERWGNRLREFDLKTYRNLYDLFPDSFNTFIKNLQGLGFDIKLLK